jgi:hypothetical protein
MAAVAARTPADNAKHLPLVMVAPRVSALLTCVDVEGLDISATCNYNKIVKIDFDPAKSARNTLERGLPFEWATEFDWETAVYWEDVRQSYPEQRFVALGFLYQRLHVLCFTPIEGGVRVISFRKANPREVRRYEQETIDRRDR